ncbi:MAG: hypothetical protein ACI837_000650 [Crocinitomicaceae bacterium]|jgi:hypothetical protein
MIEDHSEVIRKQIADAHKCVRKLSEALAPSVQILIGSGTPRDVDRYYKASLIFNRRIQQNPLIIVYCESTEDVQITYKIATKYSMPIRVRAGGHDHEGECSGTNTILIDVSKIAQVTLDPKTKIAQIGPGNRFITLTTALANENVMIPHGTCATVGIAGFTLGGGWGPWTRKEGMCCEHLVGATIMLGNGKVIDVDVDKNGDVPPLLWALRGGGGMSYGIVTEFRIQTFKLPSELIRFNLEWNPYAPEDPDVPTAIYPTVTVLNDWEEVIEATDTSKLIGTNLKISGQPLPEEKYDPMTISHNCIMYGYWEGNETDLWAFVRRHFSKGSPVLTIDPTEGGVDPKHAYGENLMGSWDRESLHDVFETMGVKTGSPLPPDFDLPAPHKITSRFVNRVGLKDKGDAQLINSLTSSMILKGNRQRGLFQYVTLGAISGDYYRKYPDGDSAFPYKDKQYTIQYQTWWNEKLKRLVKGQNNTVYKRTNRALDWMEESRDCVIQNTSGAFISFKDSSIPTRTYFDKSYDRLVEIKKAYSKDKYNHLRTRKTII